MEMITSFFVPYLLATPHKFFEHVNIDEALNLQNQAIHELLFVRTFDQVQIRLQIDTI